MQIDVVNRGHSDDKLDPQVFKDIVLKNQDVLNRISNEITKVFAALAVLMADCKSNILPFINSIEEGKNSA